MLTEHGYALLGAFLDADRCNERAGRSGSNGALGGRIDPLDRGLTLGDGVFDTLTAFNRIPFAGERHLQRLASQAAAIGIALDPDARPRRLGRACCRQAEAEHVILRTTVTRGVGGARPLAGGPADADGHRLGDAVESRPARQAGAARHQLDPPQRRLRPPRD